MTNTPGPWLVEDNLVYALGEKHGKTANRFSALVQNDNRLATPEEIKANAQLMAAAPDLLAACKALDAIDCCDGYTIPDADYPKLWNALNAARAAIAKATRS